MPTGLPVTVGIGLAAHRPGESAQDTLRRADAALYQAKAQGRDRVVLAG
nr:diguanylate cyclase [Stenotrophomonas sp. MYb238]